MDLSISIRQSGMALATVPLLGNSGAGGNALRVVGPRQQGRHYRWRWKEDEAEAALWSEWFAIPPVDMTLGRLTTFTVPASLAPAGGVSREDAGRAANDALPVSHAASTEPVDDWTALQRCFDERLGVGAVHIRQGFDSPLPWLFIDVSVPADAVLALQPVIDTVLPQALARWMQAQLWLCAMRDQVEGVCERHNARLQAWVAEGVAADLPAVPAPSWQALGLLAAFAVVQAQGPAARVISMRQLRQRYRALPQPVPAPVQRAWLDIARRAAGQQRGSAAQAWLDEAQAIATTLMSEQPMDMEGPRMLAEVLLQAARTCDGDGAVARLARAAGLAELALSRGGGALCAVTIAEVALAWSNHVRPAIALQLLEHGLQHCGYAMREPHCAKAAERCALTLRHARAALPAWQESTIAHGGESYALDPCPIAVAERAVSRLIQQGAFAEACQSAEQACRQRSASAALIALWEQASAAWHAQRPQGADRLRWQDNVRSREYARLSFSL